jgi:hypothetical protein
LEESSREGQEIQKKEQKVRTRADINRQKKLKLTLQNEKEIQAEKQLTKQINKIQQIKKEIAETDLLHSKNQLERQLKEEQDKLNKTKKLGRYGYILY